ncbi:MAG: Hsp33 family molecular chaperone HslO [Betaproteobacteria bacterium]|nr:Hsp33 family molecular chaperone HslO [Betaproteobacteria bacterium]
MNDRFQRFLFEGLDVRGAWVRLEDSWQKLQQDRGYAWPVAALLGELAAVTVLVAGQLKQPGRLTLQLQGEGPIRLLVVDCDESLRLRGMARSDPQVDPAPAPQLLGADCGGRLLLSLDLPTARQPYQSFVPLVGEGIGAIFEHYLEQSEQQPSRLFLAVSPQAVSCLFLQKMPEADRSDPDGWRRVTALAETVKPEELLGLDAAALLQRLFHEDIATRGVRLFDPVAVSYHCPEDWDKVRNVILSLGRAEAEALVRERGAIVLRDDMCHREYRFAPEDIAALFTAADPPTLH